jgi:hypothetical protein
MFHYTIKALDRATWNGFAAMVERNTGLFSGCWCTWFHDGVCERGPEERNPQFKKRMVEAGIARAALVYDGDDAVAWAEFAVGVGPVSMMSPRARSGVRTRGTTGALDLIAADGGVGVGQLEVGLAGLDHFRQGRQRPLGAGPGRCDDRLVPLVEPSVCFAAGRAGPSSRQPVLGGSRLSAEQPDAYRALHRLTA